MAESASVWRCGRGGGRAQGHERGGVVNQWIARVIGHVAARGAISGRREAGGRGAQLSRHHHVFTCLRNLAVRADTETAVHTICTFTPRKCQMTIFSDKLKD